MPAVGTVVPPARDHGHPAPVGAPEQVDGGQGRGHPGPAHQHVERRGRHGGGIDRVHLGDVEDRMHRTRRYDLDGPSAELTTSGTPTATTMATATWSVWVKDRCHRHTPARPARSAADACRTCLLYTSPSPRGGLLSRMPSSA